MIPPFDIRRSGPGSENLPIVAQHTDSTRADWYLQAEGQTVLGLARL